MLEGKDFSMPLVFSLADLSILVGNRYPPSLIACFVNLNKKWL